MNDQNDPSADERRDLQFNSIDECVADIHQILEADRNGQLRAVGNWTPGQVLSHVAAWIEYGYEGYPMKPPPFFIRWILRFQLKKILRNGMPTGVRIPGIKEGTVGMEEMPTAEAGQRAKTAFERLSKREESKYDSPAFGKMSHDDRIRLNLRHAELHLGYLKY